MMSGGLVNRTLYYGPGSYTYLALLFENGPQLKNEPSKDLCLHRFVLLLLCMVHTPALVPLFHKCSAYYELKMCLFIGLNL